MRTVALEPIPAALIAAGQPLFFVSYLQSRLVPHPDIPPLPPPMRPSVQSVPWHLIARHGREITVGWSSGTCVLPGHRTLPRPKLIINETQGTVTVTVLVHVVKANGGVCLGVALGGVLHARLGHPVGVRHLKHGNVTDHGT